MSDTTLKTPASAIVEASAVKPAPAMNGEAPSEPKRRKKNPVVVVLEALGSLRLTVTLFALSLVLVFFGTLAQIDSGIWTVVGEYFRSFFVWIKLQLLIQFGQVFFGFSKDATLPGAIPFPGGWTIGALLLVNIVSAYALRAPRYLKHRPWSYGLMSAVLGIDLIVGYVAAVTLSEWWFLTTLGLMFVVNVVMLIPLYKLIFFPGNRVGIFTVHAGIVLMLVGEFITGVWAVEGNMVLEEGETTNAVLHNRFYELAIVDPSGAEEDSITVVPSRLLKKDASITHEDLPFDITVVKWMGNSHLAEPKPGETNPATAGYGKERIAEEVGEVSGVATTQRVETPSVYVTLTDKDGKELGTRLYSVLLKEEKIEVGGKTYEVSLRFKHTYKPFSLRLEKFTFQRYTGTSTPKDFTSRVTLLDPERGDNRELNISMNKPLRHRGDTFFQADWNKDTEKGTVLQVVKNPAWQLPYWSCAIVAIGLLLHFVSNLINFLARGASE